MRMRVEKVKPGRTKVIRENPLRAGKDEMNLVEYPFAVLWQKEPGDSVIFYEWTARHPTTDQEMPASWMATGSPKFGLPTASDERVYLVLMELTREAGFLSPTVYFSRYDIIQRLGWNNTTRSYQMLQGAFDRLTGVTITAKNAFWSPRAKSYRNTAFHILEMYDINAEPPGRKAGRSRELPLSRFSWGPVIFDSFRDGYIRTLDLEFALSLKGDIALRLYRYLDKKAYNGRRDFEIDLFSLCVKHLGMKPSPHPSKLKERLKPAHDELLAKGFLNRADFETSRAPKGVKVRYEFAPRKRPAEPEVPGRESAFSFPPAPAEAPPTSTSPAPPSTSPPPAPRELSAPQRELAQALEAQRVSPAVARELAERFDPDLIRIQIECLADRNGNDPAAFLVKSIRESWALPEAFVERREARERAEEARAAQEEQKAREAQEEARRRQQQAAQADDDARLDRAWDSLPAAERDALDSRAQGMLGVLGVGGRAPAALQAMRRTLLREREAKGRAGE